MGNSAEKNSSTSNDLTEKEIIIKSSIKEIAKLFLKDSILIWYDSNINSKENIQYIEELQNICVVKTFTEHGEASSYIQNIQISCHVITSGKNGEVLVKTIIDKPHVSSINVFCKNVDYHKQWAKKYNKIQYVEDNFKALYTKLENIMMKWQRESSSLRVNFPVFAPIFDDRDKSDISHLHLYLKALPNFKNRKQAKNDFLSLSKAIYNDKKNIKDFEKNYNDYNMKNIFTWYTKESFLYKVTNNCLRIATSDSIQYCRLILKDLEAAIKEHYEKKSQNFNGLLYRGAYISPEGWNKLQENIGKEIEMYGFLSSSKEKGVALNFAKSSITQKAMITIIVPPHSQSKSNQGFAEVKEFSVFPDEEEVLFNVRSQFSILEATIEEINGIKCRHLVLLYGAQALRKYMKVSDPEIIVSIPEQAECVICRLKIQMPQQNDLFFINLSEKEQYVCYNCIKQAKIQNKSPLLCISSTLKDSKNEKLTVKGIVLQYQKVLDLPFYGSKCSECQQTKMSFCYKCLDCQEQPQKIWCEKCFNQDIKCLKDTHKIILESSPLTFWSEKMTEKEFCHIEYQDNQFSGTSGLFHQAQSFCKAHDYSKAKEYYEKFLEQNENEQTAEIGTSLNNLGEIYRTLGEHQKAVEFHFKALGIHLSIYGEEHSSVANSCNNLGELFSVMGEYDKAIKSHFRALEINKLVNGEQHNSTATSYNNLGLIYSSIGEYQEAMEYHLAALEIRRSINGEQHPLTAASHNNLGEAYRNLGEQQKAMEAYLKALEINKVIHGEKHPLVAATYTSLGVVYDSLGEYEKAIKAQTDALEINKAIYGENHPSIADSYNNIGAVYNNLGEYQKAKEIYLNALKIYETFYGTQHPSTANSYNNLGVIYLRLKEFEKALEFYLKALEVYKTVYEGNHPTLATCYLNLGMLYDILGEADKAKEYIFLSRGLKS